MTWHLSGCHAFDFDRTSHVVIPPIQLWVQLLFRPLPRIPACQETSSLIRQRSCVFERIIALRLQISNNGVRLPSSRNQVIAAKGGGTLPIQCRLDRLREARGNAQPIQPLGESSQWVFGQHSKGSQGWLACTVEPRLGQGTAGVSSFTEQLVPEAVRDFTRRREPND